MADGTGSTAQGPHKTQVPAPALAALVRPDVAGAWHRGDGTSAGGEGTETGEVSTKWAFYWEKYR